MIDEDFTKSLLEKHSYLTQRDSVDWLTVECAPEKLVSFVQSLRDFEGFEILIDLTAIDHGEGEEFRYSTVIHLYSLVHRGYVRIHSICADNDKPAMPSVSEIYPAANWHERETFDMFGIHFEGHPHPKRLLMPEDWTGWPLRKDYVQPDFYEMQAPLQGSRPTATLRHDPRSLALAVMRFYRRHKRDNQNA